MLLLSYLPTGHYHSVPKHTLHQKLPMPDNDNLLLQCLRYWSVPTLCQKSTFRSLLRIPVVHCYRRQRNKHCLTWREQLYDTVHKPLTLVCLHLAISLLLTVENLFGNLRMWRSFPRQTLHPESLPQLFDFRHKNL